MVEQIALNWQPERRLYSVSELNAGIRALLDEVFSNVWVSGEISGCKLAPSGHYYFTLKDEASQLRCACFKMTARFLKFKPRDGVAVLARGRIDVYEQRGEYQLIVEALEPQGYGALQFAFEQLKKKLAMEGLFDEGRKRPVPFLPRRIGIVTSPKGAVIQDMLQILDRRFPGLHIRVYPALVQGDGSIDQVTRGIKYFSENPWADVLIVARGGGSLEDLWTFNEEEVARAIANSPVPVISAVGHETDFTIADFVADLRAPTPSAAAELVVRTRQELFAAVETARSRAVQVVRYRLAMDRRRLQERGIDRAVAVFHRNLGRSQQQVDDWEYRMRARIAFLLSSQRRKLDALAASVQRLDVRLRFAEVRRRLGVARTAASAAVRTALRNRRVRLDLAAAGLQQLSPLRVLERGYAIVEAESGKVLKNPREAPVGSVIRARLAGGQLRAEVLPTPGGSSELPS